MVFRTMAIWVVAALSMTAQESPRDVVRGRITDLRGGPVRAAQVCAGDSTSVLSGSDGEFVIQPNSQATALRVVAPGFAEWTQRLDALETPLTVVLQVSTHREMVTVAERADYATYAIGSATKTLAPLRDVPQSVAVVNQELMRDQLMMSMADVVRYVPGVTAIQGENNRDQLVIRGNSSSADFFVDGTRDDVQYFRDLYNVERVEALKGSNALLFGRGGGGGVINRVTKEAGLAAFREVELQAGSFGTKRATLDIGQPFGKRVAIRLNGLYENSDSFRRYGHLQRWGVSPTVSVTLGGGTKLRFGYEDFHDARVADRGIPSWMGRPLAADPETYFGNPDQSQVRASVHTGFADIEHQAGRFHIRNHTTIGSFDRGYQNFVPGAVNSTRTSVAIAAYNNATRRLNIFNQTDVTTVVRTGAVRHTLLAGLEGGRQATDNFRNTGYFGNATSTTTPLADPDQRIAASFRQSATDANNHVQTLLGAAYVQDQIELTRFVQAIAGFRVDHFDLRYQNRRNSDYLRRIDNMVSPRVGLVFKPEARVSLYLSRSISWLPSSGDQFSSLTVITQQVKPEKFTNYEAGAKWDVRPGLAFTAAVYRLDRTNTRSTDPNDPTRIVQTGSQRSNGFETALIGNPTAKWRVAGGYSWQDVYVRTTTAAASAGARVAQTPAHTVSLWNNYQFRPRWAAGIGVTGRSAMFAAIDNTVVLPSYARADAALYYTLREGMRLQINVDNLTGRRCFVNADGNNNISPGSPRAFRVAWISRF